MARTVTSTSPRQDRRKARTRARIIDAAEELFSAVGDSVTIDQIAETADVAVATIYQHFAGKEDLYFAVVERAIELNEKYMVATYGSDLEPVEKLIDAAGAYLRFYLESPQLFLMIQATNVRQSSTDASNTAAAVLVSERVDRMTAALASVIAAGTRSGALRKLSSLETARALWGQMNGVILLSARPGRLRLTESELRATLLQSVDIVLEGMITDKVRGADGRMVRRLRLRLKNVIESAAPRAGEIGA
jgi:TetR/AcrR family transcriptional regulator